MPVIESDVSVNSETFKANKEFMLEAVKSFRDVEQKMRNTEEAYAPRAHKKGKLLPRERLALLIDPGSSFLELHSVAGYKMYEDRDGSTAGGSLIAGVGYVSGRRCLIIVMNYAIKGGTMTAVSVKKTLRLHEIAMEQKLPVITLSESGGGNLAGDLRDPWLPYTFIEGGRCFYNQAILSGMGIPQITVVHGNATAGGAYQPGLSDYMVLVRGKSQMFLAGPPLLKAATGEIADAEDLGGAEMHATESGTGEYLAEDDADAIRMVREIANTLPEDPQLLTAEQKSAIKQPVYPEDELIGIVPADSKIPYDVREIIARIADGSEFLDFNPSIDNQTICGHLRLEGIRVGVIGNNGPITPKGAKKAAQFIQLCDQSLTPIIFMHNTTGFHVGTEAEQAGAVKHGSKMIQAVANMRSPKISLVLGNSYGAGNYAMASRSMRPDFCFAWPISKTNVMGGAQAAMVMAIVMENKLARVGQKPDPKVVETISAGVIEKVAEIEAALSTSARLFDDGLIDPRDTRKVLAMALQVCMEGEKRDVRPNSFGIARL